MPDSICSVFHHRRAAGLVVGLSGRNRRALAPTDDTQLFVSPRGMQCAPGINTAITPPRVNSLRYHVMPLPSNCVKMIFQTVQRGHGKVKEMFGVSSCGLNKFQHKSYLGWN